MKLKQYAKKLQALAEEYPNAVVVYASDDEGNEFNLVSRDPSPGYLYDVSTGEVIDEERASEYEDTSDLKPAVIIN